MDNLDTMAAILEIGNLMKAANQYMKLPDKERKVMLLLSVADFIRSVFFAFGLDYSRNE